MQLAFAQADAGLDATILPNSRPKPLGSNCRRRSPTDMFFSRLIQFTTSQSREAVAASLSAAVLPDPSVLLLKPVRISQWSAQQQGKRFVGSFDGTRFRLRLMQMPGARLRVRIGVVIIVGSVEDNFFHARLRPPLFVLGFLILFAVALSAGIVLSFFGPANVPLLQAAMALTLVMPFATVAWFFRREATQAEHALRRAVLGA